MTYELKKLLFAYSDLEPYMDEETVKIHYYKHHQGYVDKLNAVLEKYPELQIKTPEELLINLEEIPEEIREAVTKFAGGVVNHDFFWKILRKNIVKSKIVLNEIEKRFGSYEEFKIKFTESAMNLFGSGWTWLVWNREDDKLEIINLPNQDSPLSKGLIPLLVIDLWEHAYYLKYQNRRKDFIEAFFNLIDWRVVEKNFDESRKE